MLKEDLEEQNQDLMKQLLIYENLNNLKDESYFRRQILIMLERIATAQEKTIKILEKDSSEE